jgi:two-component sensor histidine kinase
LLGYTLVKLGVRFPSSGGLIAYLSEGFGNGRLVGTASDVGLSAPDVEAAMCLCCLESIQNAAKHAGPGASVRLRLRRERHGLEFSVHDTGRGFDRRAIPEGAGLPACGSASRLSGGGSRSCPRRAAARP